MPKGSGYSLIEILVVVGIVGLLVGAGVATYNSLNVRLQVESEARALVAKLYDWQKSATSGYGAQACNGSEFGGIQVTTNLDANTITGQVVCGGNPLVDGDVLTIKNGVDLTSGETFRFEPLTGAASQTVSFQLTKASYGYQVSITQAGGISASKM